MKTTKITDTEIAELKVSSLPSRPTAPSAFGGRGFTAQEMKEAFDKLPLYIIEKFNTLLMDIASAEDDSISAVIPTGISEGHTLYTLFSDITGGKFAQYLAIGEQTLADYLTELEEWREKTDRLLADFKLRFAESASAPEIPDDKV